MIRLKNILYEATKADYATPQEYTGVNGNPSKINLININGVRLEKEAGENYKKMLDDMKSQKIKPEKVTGFRSYEKQYDIIDWDHLEQSGKHRTTWDNTVAAAPPGRSNHGLGKAIDVSGKQAQDWIRKNGVKYGWTWYKKDGGEGESINEPWHFTYRADKVGSDVKDREVDMSASDSSVFGLRRGETGVSVIDMQNRLLYLDFSVGPRLNDGVFGPYTEQGVKDFQKRYNLEITGVYDEATQNKLDSLTKTISQSELDKKVASLKRAKQSDEITSDIEYERSDAKKWSENVIDALDLAALDYNIDKEILYTIANIESKGNPEAVNKKSGASGLFQILPKYFSTYGVNKNTVWNPYINAEAAAKMLSKRVSTINKTIDRKDSANLGAYIYIAHNQGLSGFRIIYNACKNHKDLSPEAALVKSAFELKDNENLGRKVYKNMKANGSGDPCKFIQMWIRKYNRNKKQIQKRLNDE